MNPRKDSFIPSETDDLPVPPEKLISCAVMTCQRIGSDPDRDVVESIEFDWREGPVSYETGRWIGYTDFRLQESQDSEGAR
eukprot:371888-Pyramimonas_sp.AAC.1